jgi:predicted nucleic acid-binding protein
MSESERESAPRRFVVDANVFVSAIKPFSRRSRTARTGTGSLALLMRLITDTELELFGNLWLLDEYKRLGEELNSETSGLILGQLTRKMREVIEIGEEAVARCRPYLPEQEAADILHAATCLQSKAILITNDKDFDRIKESGLIEVWGISEAIRKLSIQE